MQFRRSGQRDERRRKVLLDDASAEKDATPSSANKTAKGDAVARAYAKAAVEETETRVADLIPTRPLGVFVLLLMGLTAIAGVQAIYTFVPDWSKTLGPQGVAAFDVARGGSLNSWLTALLFAVSAAMSSLIYVIRRHKMDDYRGRYRMWLWTAGLLMIASANAVAGLHHTFDAVVVHLAGKTLLANVAGWSMLAISLVGMTMGLRILMDMWRSRGSSAALLCTGLCYGVASWLVIFSPLPAETMLASTLTSLAFSMGHLMLALTTVIYARRVLLEARGLLEVKKKQPKQKAAQKKEAADKKVERKEKQAGKRKLKIDPPHQQSRQPSPAEQPVSKKASAPTNQPADDTKPTGEADEHGPVEGSPEWFQLSKAQKRRVKKLRRRKSAAA